MLIRRRQCRLGISLSIRIRSSSSPIRVAFSVFDVYTFFRACGGKTSSDWGMIGMTSVPPCPIWTDIFLFLTVLKVKDISVIFRAVVILGTEAFIVVTGNASSAFSCGSAMRICGDVPKRRILLWATWSSWVALKSWRSITIRSPSPRGSGPVNRNSKTKLTSFLW